MNNVTVILEKLLYSVAATASVLIMTSCPQQITEEMVALVEDTIPPTIEISGPRGGDNYYSTVTVTGVISDDVSVEGDSSGQITSVYYEIANDDYRKGKINIALDSSVTADTDFGSGTIVYDVSTGTFSFEISTISPTKLRDSLSLSITAVDRNNNKYTSAIDLSESDGPYIEYYYYSDNTYSESSRIDTLSGDGVYIGGTIGNSEYVTDKADELISISYGRVGLSYGASLDITEGSENWNSSSGLFSAYDSYNDQLLYYNPETRKFWTYTTEVEENGTTFYVNVSDKSGHTTEVQKLLPPPGSMNFTAVTSTIPYYSPSVSATLPITTRVVDPNDNKVEDGEVSKITYSFRSDYGEDVPLDSVEVFNIDDSVHTNPIDFWNSSGDNSDNGRFSFSLDTSELVGFSNPVKLRLQITDSNNKTNAKTLTLEPDNAGPTINVTNFATTNGNLYNGKTYLNATDTVNLAFTVTDSLSGIADNLGSITSVQINGGNATVTAEGDGAFTVSYPLSDSNTIDEASLTYAITVKDNLNNSRSSGTISDNNQIYYRAFSDSAVTKPTLSWLSSNPGHTTTWARATDTITGTVISTRVLSTETTVKIGSLEDVNISVNTPYTATSPALSGAGFIQARDNVTYTVSVVDAAGNTWPMTGDTSIDYDGAVPTAPATPSWSYGDFINISEASGNLTLTAEYSGSGALSGDTIEIYLDSITATPLTSAGWEPDYSSSITFAGSATGSDGAKTIFSRIVDAAGNIGAVSPNLDFTVDLTRPVNPLTITSNTGDGYINANELASSTDITVTVGYSSSNSNDDITLFYSSTSQTASYSSGNSSTFSITDGDLTEGNNIFTAYTVDEAENSCATPTTLTLVLDTIPPSAPTDIAAPSGGDYINADDLSGSDVNITVTYPSTDISEVTLTLDSHTYTETTDTDGETVFTVPEADLATPSSTFKATTTDTAGNESSEVSITLDVDTTPPEIPTAITTASGAGYINSSDMSGGYALVTVEYPTTGGIGQVTLILDSHTYTESSDTDGTTVFSVPEGHLTASSTFTAYTEDDAGNDSPSISETFAVDTTPPGAPTSIAALSGGNYINANDISGGNVELTVVYDSTDVNSIDLTLNSVTYTPTTNSGGTAVFTIAEADLSTTNAFTATTQDTAGNESTFNKTLTLDTTPPGIPTDIAAPSGGDYINADDLSGSNVDITVTYPASGGISKVTLELGSDNYANTTDTDGSTDFSISSSLITASNAFTATTEDSAGNESTTLNVTLTRDITPPIAPISITSNTGDGYINEAELDSPTAVTVTVGYGSSNNADKIRLYYSSTSQTVDYDSGNSSAFTIPDGALSEGDNVFTAYTVDAAGNESSTYQSLTLVMDITPPVAPTSISSTAGSDNYINADEYNSATDITVTVGYNNSNSNDSIKLYYNSYSDTKPYDNSKSSDFAIADSSLVTGNNVFTAYTVDIAGNECTTPQTLTLILDTEAPAASNWPSTTQTNSTSTYTFDPGISDNISTVGDITFDWTVDSSSYSTSSALSVSSLTAGDHTIGLTATDQAGNSFEDIFTLTWDTAKSITLLSNKPPTVSSSGNGSSSATKTTSTSSGSRYTRVYTGSSKDTTSSDSTTPAFSGERTAVQTSYTGGAYRPPVETEKVTISDISLNQKIDVDTDSTTASTDNIVPVSEKLEAEQKTATARPVVGASSAARKIKSGAESSEAEMTALTNRESGFIVPTVLILLLAGTGAGIIFIRRRQ